jgi:hypothetical protein
MSSKHLYDDSGPIELGKRQATEGLVVAASLITQDSAHYGGESKLGRTLR